MMKPTNAGQSYNLGIRRRAGLGGSPDREIPKPSVDSVGVVVVDVFAEKTLKVFLVQDNHMV
jgi:hypothetical protein